MDYETNKTMKKILLDAREMAHLKPLELGINILKKLDDESYLYMLHRKHPVPLIDKQSVFFNQFI